MYFGKGERTENNKVFMKIYTMYKSMMQRCYNENSDRYKNYGAKGVHVSGEWKDLDNFIDTIDMVDGFDLGKILRGELQLDKDIKYKGNKIYSKENCTFVSPEENQGYKPSIMRPFIAIDPRGNRYEAYNREKFAREHELNTRSIWNVLQKDTYHTHKGWQFFYSSNFKEDMVNKKPIYVGVSPNLKIYKFSSIAEFARTHKLSSPNISMVISGKNKHINIGSSSQKRSSQKIT